MAIDFRRMCVVDYLQPAVAVTAVETV